MAMRPREAARLVVDGHHDHRLAGDVGHLLGEERRDSDALAARLVGPGAAGTGGGNWIATLWGIESSQFTGTAEANNLGLLVNSVGVNSTTFRTAPPALFNGVVNQPSQPMLVPGFATDGTDGGKRATFQMRVWDTTGGIDTWAKVLTSPGTFRGYSDVFTVPYPLGGTLSPANTPPFLQGLTSFNVFTVVPEPSVIALGVLGAGCLFLLRRRK